MRKLLILTICSGLGLHVAAQSISQVQFNPSQISECDQVVMTMVGVYPSNNYMGASFTANLTGNVITFQYLANGSGTSGGGNFSETVPAVGPWPPGTYTFNAELLLNGSTTPSAVWSTTLVVTAGLIPDPGQDTFINICNSIPSFSMTGALDGSADTWGEWFDPSGLPHSGTFIPGTDPPGVYLYVFEQGGPCVDTLSQLLVSYTPNTSAGANTQALICATGGQVDLFTLIATSPVGPTASGGTWTDPNSAPFSGLFTPGTDQPGNYTYTVTGQAPCGNPSSIMTVSLVNGGSAGLGGITQVCADDTLLELYPLLTGAADTTGTWYDPIGFILANGPWASIDPSTDFPGDYLYVVPGGACVDDTAIVEVQIVPLPCDIGIGEIDGNVDRFDIMPNPVTDQVNVLLSFKQVEPEQRIQLLTITAIVVDDRRVTIAEQQAGRLSLNVQDLDQGTYLLRMYSGNGSVVRKLVKY